jgi:hypothetical protein
MSNIQIKDVPEEVHERLRRRAERANMSLRDYVLSLIDRDLATPSKEDWLRSLRRLERARLARPAATLIREQRSGRARRR